MDDLGSGVGAAPQENGVENAAGDGDFAGLAAIEGEGDVAIVRANEGDTGDGEMGRIENLASDAE